MNFNFSRMTTLSVSVLSLSILSGCSNVGHSSNTSTNTNDNSYDSYYGNAKNSQRQNAVYSPKYTRTYSKAIFKSTAPKRYTVRRGDTLWGISHKFLNNPSYWPEIWDVNQKVQNPHRIYPGDILYIYEGGKRKIKQSDGSYVEKLVPQLRIDRRGSGEPISTLSSFLVWPRVLDNQTIKQAPYILRSREASMLIEKNQTVYIRNLADRQPGGRYAVFHSGKELKDPDTGREFGKEVVYTGFLEVEKPAMNAEVATARVAESLREIRPGDRLLYINNETHDLKAPIQVPNRIIRGSVISLFDANLMSGQTQIVVINKGARDGIKAGYTLGVYSPGKTVDDPYMKNDRKYFWDPVTARKVTLPPGRAATAIVYKVLDGISYALLNSSTHEVKAGFKIGNP